MRVSSRPSHVQPQNDGLYSMECVYGGARPSQVQPQSDGLVSVQPQSDGLYSMECEYGGELGHRRFNHKVMA